MSVEPLTASTAEYVKLVQTKDRVFFFIYVGVGGTSSDRDVQDPFLGRGDFLGVDKALYRFKLTIHKLKFCVIRLFANLLVWCGSKYIPLENQFVYIGILPYNLLFCMNMPPFPFKLLRFNKLDAF